MIPMRPREVLGALIDEKVDFVLIGGLATMIHGGTRVTRDIDIAHATHRGNLERLCRALNRFEPRRIVFGEPTGRVMKLTPELLKRNGVIQLATTAGEVDLLDKIEGFASYSYVKTLSEIQKLGVPVPVLSAEGLIKTKRAMNRPKDIQDIAELQAIQEARELTAERGASFRLRGPGF